MTTGFNQIRSKESEEMTADVLKASFEFLNRKTNMTRDLFGSIYNNGGMEFVNRLVKLLEELEYDAPRKR